jgi:hypothetical protein
MRSSGIKSNKLTFPQHQPCAQYYANGSGKFEIMIKETGNITK